MPYVALAIFLLCWVFITSFYLSLRWFLYISANELLLQIGSHMPQGCRIEGKKYSLGFPLICFFFFFCCLAVLQLIVHCGYIKMIMNKCIINSPSVVSLNVATRRIENIIVSFSVYVVYWSDKKKQYSRSSWHLLYGKEFKVRGCSLQSGLHLYHLSSNSFKWAFTHLNLCNDVFETFYSVLASLFIFTASQFYIFLFLLFLLQQFFLLLFFYTYHITLLPSLI